MAGRTWVAVLLCFLVWFGYLKWFAPPPPPAAKTSAQAQTAATTPGLGAPGGNATTSELFGAETRKIFQATPQPTDLTAVETPALTARFSALGGKPHDVTLRNYHVTVDDESPMVQTLSAETAPFAGATFFSDPALSAFSDGRYTAKVDGKTVVFTRSEGGITVRKEYRIPEEGYLGEWNMVITLPAGDRQEFGDLIVPLGGTGLKYDMQVPMDAWEVVARQDGSIERRPYKDLGEQEVLRGGTEWLAFGNRYFASVIATRSAINPDVVLVGGTQFTGGYLRYPLRAKAGQRELTFSFQVYSGPKDLHQLAAIDGLKELVDYGMFSVLAFPLLYLLKLFNQFIHNYGVAIILLTLLVRALFYPLTKKSMSSMKAMQKLQPQIQALKEKYKDDRERMNREQMALFKAHKVNPAAGCLPMLVQLPVFIALYQVLANSMELFHSPFFGWIQDLSAKDPYYIYPVLMGLAMFAQQKLTPTAGMEPAQQKMMLLMPVIFSFFMLNLPSGLTLYIFVSTLLGMVQQYFSTREARQEAAAVASASGTATKG